MTFEWVPDRRLFVSYHIGEVASAADCDAWLAAYADNFAKAGARFDLVAVVEMFSVQRDMFEQFDARRGVAYAKYIRHSVRVTPAANPLIVPATRTLVFGSASDIPAAMDMIDAMRGDSAPALKARTR